jgi:hypothetical protein
MGRWVVLVSWALGVLWGQTTATLSGRVEDPIGLAVAGASVRLENALTGYRVEAATDETGEFSIANIPFQDYTLIVSKPGFTEKRQPVALRTNIPVNLTITLSVTEVFEQVSVEAFATRELVDAEATGTRTQLNLAQIERMPVPVGSRALEAILVSFPGFAANANGAIHPRGAHNQMTYVIDGMPISDQLTGAFGNGIDANIVQTIELFTGNIPAEYGSKISGVAHITTRSGLNSGRKLFGSTEAAAAQFDQLSSVTQLGGETGRFGYFTSVSLQKSNRFLDQVSRDNLHNGGNAERAFVRLDYQLGSADFLRVNLMAGRSSFQLANLRSQHAAGQDQRQLLRDAAVSVGYLHVIGPAATFDSTSSYRTSIAQLFPSPGDTPVTAAQARHLSNLTLAKRLSWLQGRHEWRAGFDYQYFPMSENFSFAITSPHFNDPNSDRFIPTLLAFDLSRGGRRFEFSGKGAGHQFSGFLQDKLRLGPWVFQLGLRYDNYRFLVRDDQWQPRLGLAYHLKKTGTVFRASYNRIFQTPVNENLLLSNSDESTVLVLPEVRATAGGALIRIRPERQNVYEIGVQQSLKGVAGLNAMFYRKDITNLHDNDNFFNTGIIFPTALARARVRGAEGRISVPERRGLSASASFTHYSVLVHPPFTGGLFLGSSAIELLSSGPFVIDHDQKLALHTVATYRSPRGLWASCSLRYDSGLVSNPSDPDEVARDPDYADLLPYVDLASDPPRVKPRTILDLAAGHEQRKDGARRWEVALQVSNVTNRTALYNFQSIFVGTRLVQPRTFGVRLRWYW